MRIVDRHAGHVALDTDVRGNSTKIKRKRQKEGGNTLEDVMSWLKRTQEVDCLLRDECLNQSCQNIRNVWVYSSQKVKKKMQHTHSHTHKGQPGNTNVL